MGVQTIIHGRILLDGDFKKSWQFIDSLKNDDRYPVIRTEMFSGGAIETNFYYEQPVIAFGANYKGLEYDWACFIIKFENILRNIEFDTAKIQMETGFIGTYNFFWKSKFKVKELEPEEKLIETEEWHLGYGYRSRWGDLIENLRDEHIFDIEFEYPIKFDDIAIHEFLLKINSMNINEVAYLNFNNQSKLLPILTHYYANKIIDWDFESGKGYWVKKFQNI